MDKEIKEKKMDVLKRSFLFVISLSLPTGVLAEKFSSQFCEFELPPGWECALEGTEWVCQSTNADRKKEAIIVLAAKERGEQDSLEAYQGYLKEKKVFQLPGGKNIVSEPSYTKSIQINDHPWIDSLHLQSEIPGFYTRYLATVKEKLGVAVTFSVAKDHYSTYLSMFDKMIQTLRVFAPSKYSDTGQFKLASDKGGDLDGVDFVADEAIPTVNPGGAQKKRVPAAGGDDSGVWVALALAAAAGGFFVVKSRKKKKRKKG